MPALASLLVASAAAIRVRELGSSGIKVNGASALLIATVTCAGLFLEESVNESRSFLAIVEQFIRERGGEKTVSARRSSPCVSASR